MRDGPGQRWDIPASGNDQEPEEGEKRERIEEVDIEGFYELLEEELHLGLSGPSSRDISAYLSDMHDGDFLLKRAFAVFKGVTGIENSDPGDADGVKEWVEELDLSYEDFKTRTRKLLESDEFERVSAHRMGVDDGRYDGDDLRKFAEELLKGEKTEVLGKDHLALELEGGDLKSMNENYGFFDTRRLYGSAIIGFEKFGDSYQDGGRLFMREELVRKMEGYEESNS